MSLINFQSNRRKVRKWTLSDDRTLLMQISTGMKPARIAHFLGRGGAGSVQARFKRLIDLGLDSGGAALEEYHRDQRTAY